ncbi:MAG: hypothetical protein ACXAC7_05705 [Candidatus Hodarchaeales archaeon]|jgi:translin
MKNHISKIFDDLRVHLDNDDKDREEILRISRKCVRKCAETIRSTHRRELDEAKKLLDTIKTDLRSMTKLISQNCLFESNVLTAFQEYVEAFQFYHFVFTDKSDAINIIPLDTIQKDIPLPYIAYLHGLCDLIGELRRYTLDSIRTDAIEKGERSLILMDEIFIQLTTLDYPNGLVPGIRRKTDIARNLIERTRGDLTIAYNRRSLVQKLDKIIDSSSENSSYNKTSLNNQNFVD